MLTLVDSNVVLDYLTEDEEWADWSAAMLREAATVGGVAINQIVFAEVAVKFGTNEALDAALPKDYFARLSVPWEAAFAASKAFAQYRRRGGAKRSPLPDFFIGAHAAVAGMALLTRDPRRYRAYFPKLKLICP